MDGMTSLVYVVKLRFLHPCDLQSRSIDAWLAHRHLRKRRRGGMVVLADLRALAELLVQIYKEETFAETQNVKD